MPSVVNGCGTWYYGKRNLQQYAGTCSACHNQAQLKSYDTRLFVVFLFIPIFPLGRKRIIEECGVCQRHGAMSLGDYERAKRRADEAIAAYRAKPTNADLAQEALGACTSFRHLPAMLEVAPDIERNQARDPKTLAILGVVYDTFGRTTDQERVLRLALGENRPDGDPVEADEGLLDEISEMLAGCLMRQGRPEDAEPYVAHIVNKGIPDRIDSLYQLAQGYQLKGNHEKALEYFGHCETINPHILQDETFVRLRDESGRNRGTATAVRPNEVVRKAKSKASRQKFMKVAPVVLVLAAGAYLTLAWAMGRNQRVHLVNGIGRPYTFSLNGTSYPLAAGGHVAARVPQGDVRVEISGIDGAPGPEVLKVRTPLLTRPFASPAVVINPDGAAILMKRRAYYGPSAPPPVDTYFAGQTLHVIDSIDHAFEPFPASIEAKASSGTISRNGVQVVDARSHAGMSGAQLLATHADLIGKDAAARVAQRRLLLEPEQYDYLAVLQGMMSQDELVALLRPRLADRPVRIDWHRAYQNMMEVAGREQDVEREYRELLAKEPGDATLMYLASRAEPDIDRARELCERAASAAKPCPYANYSLGWTHLGNAEFDAAADRARQALKLEPSRVEFNWLLKRALLSGGRFAEAVEVLDKERSTPSITDAMAAAADEAYAQHLQGNKAGARSVIESIKSRVRLLDQAAAVEAGKQIEAQLAYCDGDVKAFVAALTDSGSNPQERTIARLTSGELDAVENEVAQLKQPSAQTHLLCYLADQRAGRTDLADKHLAAAIELLAKGSIEHRAFAAALGGKPTMPAAELMRQRVEPDEKAVLLTALGQYDPSAREACFALARKLNAADTRFPYLLLRDVLGGDGGPAGAKPASAAKPAKSVKLPAAKPGGGR